MTYAEAVELAWERSQANGTLSSRELYRLLADDAEAYQDYVRLRGGEPPTAPERAIAAGAR